MNRAIFFDKDGVLNEDTDIKLQLKVTPYAYAGDTIVYFRSQGFKIFVISNQPIVARGLVTEKQLLEHLAEFQKNILRQKPGAKIDKIYYCPHHPDATLEKYRVSCECRKPRPGMLVRAAREFEIELKESCMVGDRVSDIMAGKLAGCSTVLCMTGKHLEKMIRTDLKYPAEPEADFKVKDITGLKDIIK